VVPISSFDPAGSISREEARSGGGSCYPADSGGGPGGRPRCGTATRQGTGEGRGAGIGVGGAPVDAVAVDGGGGAGAPSTLSMTASRAAAKRAISAAAAVAFAGGRLGTTTSVGMVRTAAHCMSASKGRCIPLLLRPQYQTSASRHAVAHWQSVAPGAGGPLEYVPVSSQYVRNSSTRGVYLATVASPATAAGATAVGATAAARSRATAACKISSSARSCTIRALEETSLASCCRRRACAASCAAAA